MNSFVQLLMQMHLNSLKADGLLTLQGEPVCVEFRAKEGQVCGNICTIDPITRSIVLTVFGQNGLFLK